MNRGFRGRRSQADDHARWNGCVPYVLKQWIDIITQPGCAFGFDPVARYSGIVRGKKAAAVYASGVYSVGASPAFGRDFHSTFFTDWLQFIGIDQVTEIRWQPTVLATSRDQQDRATALDHATAAGQGPSWAELACCYHRSR